MLQARKYSPLSIALLILSCGGSTDNPIIEPPVTVVPVATITMSRSALGMLVGDADQLFATPRDQSGNVLNRTVTWTSSDSAVARVTNGVVSAVSPGLATITATSEGKTASAAITVSATFSVSFASVVAGGAHTCALTPAGAAFCWGRGEAGQLGVPAPPASCTSEGVAYSCSKFPVAVKGGLTFTRLDAGSAHTCALTSDGTAYCWGDNTNGQLGVAGPSQNAPISVATTLKFVSIDAGAAHTCALTSGGAAYCWGNNLRGQLGDGTTTQRSSPVAVSGGLVFKTISAGGYLVGHTCGLTNSGVAYCWGDNDRGQLGSGTASTAPQPLPVAVTGAITFASLTAGLGRQSCGLTVSGAAFCWGANDTGALGDGTRTDAAYPVQVTGDLLFTQIAVGGFNGFSCGRTSAGLLYCWGENVAGQLGAITTSDRLAPGAVTGGISFLTVETGFRHTCGRSSSGIVYCWGSNGTGQLGNNSNGSTPTPVKVTGQP